MTRRMQSDQSVESLTHKDPDPSMKLLVVNVDFKLPYSVEGPEIYLPFPASRARPTVEGKPDDDRLFDRLGAAPPTRTPAALGARS